MFSDWLECRHLQETIENRGSRSEFLFMVQTNDRNREYEARSSVIYATPQ